MDTAIQSAIRARAQGRCEYCRFPERFAELPFHCDHIVAQQHGGKTEVANLAFACCFCNRFKGPNLSGVDPLSGEVVRLFDPCLSGSLTNHARSAGFSPLPPDFARGG